MFGALRMWEEYIEALCQLGNRELAQEVTRARLKVEPTLDLW